MFHNLYLLYFLLFFFVVDARASNNTKPINVAVASNFAPTLNTIVDQYQQRTGQPINILIGSTGKHYLQILHGAPIDVFFAADQKRPKKLIKHQKASSQFTYAVGKLAYWRPSYKGDAITFEQAFLLPSKHISLANPRHAPYGLAAKQTLSYLSLRNKNIKQKATHVIAENISQSANLISTKAVDAGFIAYAHAIQSGLSNFWLVPTHYHSPIKQDAVIIRRSKLVNEFIKYVQSDEVKNIIKTHGYLVDD